MSQWPGEVFYLFQLFLIAITGAVFCWMPSLTRRDIFFAVTVSPDFPRSAEGARIRRSYQLWTGTQTAVAMILVFAGWKLGRPWLALTAPYWLLAAALPAFLWARRRAQAHATAPSTVREAGLQTRTLGALQHPILQTGPFAILLAAAIYLWKRWDDIPARFPIHWDFNGVANGWAHKNFAGVFGILLGGAVLCAMLLMMNVLILHATRQISARGAAAERESRFRRTQVGVVLGSEYFLALLMAGCALLPLLNAESINGMMGGILALSLAFVTIVIVVLAHTGQGGERLAPEAAATEAAAPVGDRTSDACWKAGIFYVNRDDPAVLVEKRFGLGYTLNFGNPRSWLLLAAVVVVSAALILGLRLAK